VNEELGWRLLAAMRKDLRAEHFEDTLGWSGGDLDSFFDAWGFRRENLWDGHNIWYAPNPCQAHCYVPPMVPSTE
jgi:hypothetical protein